MSHESNQVKLQRIQNTLARVVADTIRRKHITPVLKDLHWLPIEQRINYKIAVITYNILREKQPAYLSDIVSVQEPTKVLKPAS